MSLKSATSTRIDEIVRLRQSAGRAPSVIAAVVRDGDLVHITSAGARVGGRTADVQGRIGSISKTFTAALVLGLRDEGRLDLDQPVTAHLPGLPIGAITPRQILAHVSGLQREPDGPWWERNHGVDIPTLLTAIAPSAMIHPPLRTYHYSNMGYGLLGALVTAVTGESWADALADRICKPLRLDRTTYAPQDPYLRGYVVHPYADALREEPREDAGAMAPAGQIWSTLTDLGIWAAFIADPASFAADAPLAPATVDEMCVPVAISDPESWSAGHSLGFQMWRAGDRVYLGHTGSMPGYLAVIIVHRKTRTAVVAFANAYSLGGVSIGGLGMELLTAVLDGEPEVSRPWTASEPPTDIAPLLGAWWWMGDTFEAVWDGDLVLHGAGRSGMTPWRFTGIGPDAWRCSSGMNDGETMYVRRDASGTPVELDIATFILSRDPWPSVVR